METVVLHSLNLLLAQLSKSWIKTWMHVSIMVVDCSKEGL